MQYFNNFNKKRAIFTSFTLSNCLYWLPACLGSNLTEYFVWAPVFIISWFIAGLISSLLTIKIINKIKHANNM